jgi:hypothetical protein
MKTRLKQNMIHFIFQMKKKKQDVSIKKEKRRNLKDKEKNRKTPILKGFVIFTKH